MKRLINTLQSEEAEINVSPLIDLVFILLIFFIVATSFINEIGITSNYKDTSSSTSEISTPLIFELTSSGQLKQNGSVIGLEQVAPIVRTARDESKSSVLLKVSHGSNAGLATEVMDQAMFGGAKAVKLSAVP